MWPNCAVKKIAWSWYFLFCCRPPLLFLYTKTLPWVNYFLFASWAHLRRRDTHTMASLWAFSTTRAICCSASLSRRACNVNLWHSQPPTHRPLLLCYPFSQFERLYYTVIFSTLLIYQKSHCYLLQANSAAVKVLVSLHNNSVTNGFGWNSQEVENGNKNK